MRSGVFQEKSSNLEKYKNGDTLVNQESTCITAQGLTVFPILEDHLTASADLCQSTRVGIKSFSSKYCITALWKPFSSMLRYLRFVWLCVPVATSVKFDY